MSAPTVQARLLGRSGKLAGQTFDLGPDTRIGRDPSNDIVVEDPSVSKRHARIAFRDGKFHLEDLESTHGTKLDGVAVDAPVPLDRLHVIEFSDVEFVYTQGPAREASEDAPEPAAPAAAEEESAATPDAEPPREEAGAGASGGEPPTPSGGKGPGGAEERGTIIDSAGFGTLPELQRDEVDDPNKTQIGPAPVSESAPRFELTVELPDEGPTTFPLKPGDNVVGRADDCDITIVDPAMWLSRKHAIVRVKDDGVELIDLKGVNGTFVDGKKIDTAVLEPGSTFMLGPHMEFTLQAR